MTSQVDVMDCHLLAANLNAMVFDFVPRGRKCQGQTLNLFIVEQLPVIAASGLRPAIFGDI